MNIHAKVGLSIFLYALIGLWFVQDYGMSYDDQHNREFGLATYDFIKAKIMGQTYVCANEYCVMSRYHGLIHGPVIELLLVILEKAYRLTDLHTIYQMRHSVTWLIFCIGLGFMYLLCTALTKSIPLSILGTLWLGLTPRIFADAFYNSVDIPLLVGCLVLAYLLTRFLEKPTLQRALFLGICTGIVSDIRIVGLIWVPLTLGLFWYVHRHTFSEIKILHYCAGYGGSTLLTLFLCWPLLWKNPLLLFPALNEVARFDMLVTSLFGGEILFGPGAPKAYLFTWMGITLPLSIIFLGIIGLYSISIQLCSQKKKEFSLLLPLLWFILPLLAVVICNPTLYSGWRHFFFLYPAFILCALQGIQSIYLQIRNNQLFTTLFSFFLVLSVIYLVFSIVAYHPYQHLYFNALAPSMTAPCEQYDTDYWGLSYKEIFENVLAQDNRSLIHVHTKHIQAPHFLSALPYEKRIRIMLVNTSARAEYYVTNYYERKNICNKQKMSNLSVTKRVKGIPLYTIEKLS